MRTATLRHLAGATLLALLLPSGPAGAASFGWGGDLGFSLNQENSWVANGASSNTVYTMSGGLRLNYSPFAPGVLDLGAAASYLGYRAVGGSASDGLNYALTVSALRQTPLNLSATAFRSTTEFTADRNNARVGSTRVDGLAATATLATVDYPFLMASWNTSASESRPMGAAPVKSDVTGVAAAVVQSVDSLYYQLTFDTAWSGGDYAETNYRNRNAQFSANAQLATNVMARAAANYTLRLPTLESPLNPRLDNQSFTAGLQWNTPGLINSSVSYNYSSSLFAAPGSPLRQGITHSLSATVSKDLSSQLAYDLGGSASASLNRNGTAEQQASGEQVNGGLRWNREVSTTAWLASVNGGYGRFQPGGGAPSTSAWSLGGSVNASRPVGTWNTSAGLNASYSANGGASAGHGSRINGMLSAGGSPFGWSFSSMLTGGYSSTDSPLYGQNHQAVARFEAHAARSGWNLSLDAAVTDDISQLMVTGAPPASVIAPIDYNTQSRYAVATASLPPIQRLILSFMGRTLHYSAPGRPSSWESGLSVNATYFIGAFNLSLYDQVTTGGSSGLSSGTQNLLFFSVSRHFGR